MKTTLTVGRAELLQWIERSRLQDYELAARLDITRAYLSQILRGRRRPGLDIAVRICTLTGVRPIAWTERFSSDLDRALIGDRRRAPVSGEKKAS